MAQVDFRNHNEPMNHHRIYASYSDGSEVRIAALEFAYAGEHEMLISVEQAIEDWIKTEEGYRYCQSIHFDFNWGDAWCKIPDEHWQRYGLIPVRHNHLFEYYVPHDEVFIPSRDTNDDPS